MSLDVSLYSKNPISKKGTGVFIRENGNTKELTIEEVRKKFPNALIEENEFETNCVFDANITHNLGRMADKAGIYEACWRPYYLHPDCPKEFANYDEEYAFEESHPMLAKDIIQKLEKGYEDMKARPDYFKQFDSENGWGLYIHFLPWVEKYLNACKTYPDAEIFVSR